MLGAVGCKTDRPSNSEHILALLRPSATLAHRWPHISLSVSYLLASLGLSQEMLSQLVTHFRNFHSATLCPEPSLFMKGLDSMLPSHFTEEYVEIQDRTQNLEVV